MRLSIFMQCCSLSLAYQCKRPLASKNYSAEKMSGFWYEVGRFQTAGGAIFQAGKVCTGFEFIPRAKGAMVDYTSRVSEPTGRWSNITGRLYPNEDMVDGNFYQKFPWSEDPGVSWNIIYLDNDWAIEYDCDEMDDGRIEYCVHFEHRTPDYDPAELEELIEFVNELDLNELNRKMHMEDQTDCW